MTRWAIILIPVITAAMAWHFVTLAFWDGAKGALLVALSVIAAGVLVRLARGFPFTNPEHYEVEEIRKLSSAVSQIMRSLRALIFVTLGTMGALIIAKPILAYSREWPDLGPVSDLIEPAISGVLGLLFGYVFWRIAQVVRGDQDLTELQSKFIVRAVERQQASRFDQQQQAIERPFKAPEGYGRRIEPQ